LPEKKVEPIKETEPVVDPEKKEEPMGYPPPPQKKKKQSKLDNHKKAIHNALEKNDSKASIARRFKISLSGFNNWLKKNPLEVD
ncbi:MAG: hypothetical protein DRQ78_07900, partial [Epsilonproteobacteria bacterium]